MELFIKKISNCVELPFKGGKTHPTVCPQLPPSSKSFQEAQSELNHAAADLNQAAGEVVHATRGPSGELAAASGKFSEDFDEFLDAGIEMAGQAQVRRGDSSTFGQ